MRALPAHPIIAQRRGCRFLAARQWGYSVSPLWRSTMWYHPAAFALGKRDVVAAWLVCLAISAAFFGLPAVESLIDAKAASTGTGPSAVNCRPGARAQADQQG